jgi:hypothetical protein
MAQVNQPAPSLDVEFFGSGHDFECLVRALPDE